MWARGVTYIHWRALRGRCLLLLGLQGTNFSEKNFILRHGLRLSSLRPLGGGPKARLRLPKITVKAHPQLIFDVRQRLDLAGDGVGRPLRRAEAEVRPGRRRHGDEQRRPAGPHLCVADGFASPMDRATQPT